MAQDRKLLQFRWMSTRNCWQQNTELKIIYHKLESCTITTEKYTFHEFVQNMHDALHSVELDAEAPAPVIPGMVEPLAAMHAQGAERLTDAEQL